MLPVRVLGASLALVPRGMGKEAWMTHTVPLSCHQSPLRPPSSWGTAYRPQAAASTPWAAVLLGCLGGQLCLQRQKLMNNNDLCVPVHREDASFEEDDDLSEEEEEKELAPIMPAKK